LLTLVLYGMPRLETLLFPVWGELDFSHLVLVEGKDKHKQESTLHIRRCSNMR